MYENVIKFSSHCFRKYVVNYSGKFFRSEISKNVRMFVFASSWYWLTARHLMFKVHVYLTRSRHLLFHLKRARSKIIFGPVSTHLNQTIYTKTYINSTSLNRLLPSAIVPSSFIVTTQVLQFCLVMLIAEKNFDQKLLQTIKNNESLLKILKFQIGILKVILPNSLA